VHDPRANGIAVGARDLTAVQRPAVGVAGVLCTVVTYDPAPALPAHLRALRSQCGKLVVVDNGSANVQWVAEVAAQCGCDLVRNNSNLGIASALNVGARIALDQGFDWLGTFDQDSLCPSGAIEGLLALEQAHPRGSQIGVLSMEQRDRVLQRGYHHRLDILEETVHWRRLRTTITSGSLLRVAALRQSGAFDDALFIDMVDHELCLRLRRHGWLVVEARDVVMAHSIGDASVHRLLWLPVVCTNHSATRRYYRVRNQLEVSRRNLWFDPVWAVKGVFQLFAPAVAVLLFEQQRGAKLAAMVRGAADFVLRRFGRLR
jgi:rhamnosyltransferase